jgi:2-oxoisovalerate dehydrogenase E1 component
MLLQAVGAADDPASGGRQMPSHWGDPRFNIVSSSSCTGTQFLHAVGCAEANRYQDPESDAITLVASGDGATSEGEFWESLNAASLNRLPVLFLIEDNGYAISVPVECQTAGASISALVSGFPALFQREVDGCDFLASYEAMQAAVDYCRQGRGPALVHAHVIRPYSHSLSDDERLYKTPAEKACSIRTRCAASRWRWTAKCTTPRNRLCTPIRRRATPRYGTCTPRKSIPLRTSSTHPRNSMANRKPWSIC